MLPFFENIDLDRNGHLDIFELSELLSHFISRYEECHNVKLNAEDKKAMEERLFDEMDADKSGTIDLLELKVFLTRKYDLMFRKKNWVS